MMGNRGISDIEIERFVQGELRSDRLAEIERLRAEDPVLSARIVAVTDSDREILETYPPRQMAAAIREAAKQSDAPGHGPLRIALPAFGAAVAAVVLTVVFLPPSRNPATRSDASQTESAVEPTRLKGPTSPSLFVFRKGETGDERLLSGQSATAGDVVQLKYSAKGATYGVIFSIDGRGTVTLHYPGNDRAKTALEQKGTHALNFSYELDDAPLYERFFFVTANHPIDPKEVIERAQTEKPGENGRLSLDPTLSQCDFLLKKSQ